MAAPTASDREEAARRLQRLLATRFTISLAFVGLVVTGFALAIALKRSPVGLILLGTGMALRLATWPFDRHSQRQMRELAPLEGSPPRWWYESGTGEVVEGASPGPRWDGPYATRENALRAPEIARRRADAWNAEDD